MDVEMAFDNLNWDILNTTMVTQGLDPVVVNMIKNMYSQATAQLILPQAQPYQLTKGG